MRVRVHYPGERGRLSLRADVDWERDIHPIESASNEFELETESRFVYFKPVLVADKKRRWSRGDDYLAIRGESGVLDIYPNFEPDDSCSACELRTVGGYRYRVFLPPGYDENPLKFYPVLYMQDGQNLFFAEEAYQGEHWKVGETLDVLQSMNAIERVIVVGIYPRNRAEDYTLSGYESYGNFLVRQLKPTIDAAFRTLRQPDRTLVMGSSLGAVASFYLAWQWPEVFGMAACLSSTFGYRDDLRERVRAEPRRNLRIYLDSGWPQDNYETTRDMRSLLIARGFREGIDLHYFAFPHAGHNEVAWATRSHIPYQLFFRRRLGTT